MTTAFRPRPVYVGASWMAPVGRYNGKDKDTVIVGKRKTLLLDSKKDRTLLDRHIDEFNAMHRWFREHPEALPEDYK